MPGSTLYKDAQMLHEKFDMLLCQWVHNVQDKSILDVAKGPWDDWMYLRYFDAPDPTANFSRLSGAVGDEDQFVQCTMCEDQVSDNYCMDC